MAIEATAAALVSGLLAPLVKSGVETLATQVGEALGAATASSWSTKMKSVWSRLTSGFGSATEQAVLEEFEHAPDSEDAQVLLKLKLERKLAEDPELAAELRGLLETLEAARQASSGGGAKVGDVAGDAGIADARNADLRHSKDARVIGLQKTSEPKD
jgi:hypothetical protein